MGLVEKDGCRSRILFLSADSGDHGHSEYELGEHQGGGVEPMICREIMDRMPFHAKQIMPSGLAPAWLASGCSDLHSRSASLMFAEYLPQLREAAPVILSLIVIEGLLSVDNLLAIATLASQLPAQQKKRALRLGLAGAYVFRGVALFFVGFIMANAWVKFLGAFYLIHLMAEHFSNWAAENDHNPAIKPTKPRTFWATVIAIQLLDLSLSVDNVVTAVAMSSDIRVVCIGVFLGLLTLWMFATFSLKLVERFPILEHTAFLLIGYVGVILFAEMTAAYGFHHLLHIRPEQKFIGVVIIMVLSIWYSRSATVRKACEPLLKAFNMPMTLYGKVFGTLIGVLWRPFRALGSLFQ
jgi:YkoY family integral membrane protein